MKDTRLSISYSYCQMMYSGNETFFMKYCFILNNIKCRHLAKINNPDFPLTKI